MKKALGALAGIFLMAAVLGGRPTDPNDSWREFQSRYGRQWVAHKTDRGTVRSMYGQSTMAGATAEQAASAFLSDSADVLGIDRVSDLRLASVERTPYGADFLYEQYFSGLRVAGGDVTVHVDRFNRVIAATSAYRSLHPSRQTQLAGEAAAQQTALRFVGNRGIASSQGLWIVDAAGAAQPAWRFQAASESRGGSYLLYIDASSPSRILRIHRTYADATGTGSVYLENPVVTPDPSEQPFNNLGASPQLIGKFVRTYNGNFQHWYFSSQDISVFTTASDPGHRYVYPTTDARFAEAMAYFHINKVHDQWQSFGFNKLNLPFPVFVNIVTNSGTGFDNAFYRRYANASKAGAIIMGAGNRLGNFGWDGDVYYHEYGHAVLDRVKPGFFEALDSNYPGAFHEAFGDISAAAITGNPKLAEFALRLKASKKYIGRNLDNHQSFPKNVIEPGYGRSEAHYTGEIMGGAWWDLQGSIGRPAAQRILYRSLALLPNEMTFFDVRDAMIRVDANLNGGANQAAIQNSFAQHGLGGPDPGQPGAVTVTSVKTALITFTSTALKVQLKNAFKSGEVVSILAGYHAANLIPGFNLVTETTQLAGPDNTQAAVYPYWDEAINGTHTGKQGAWLVDVDTTGAKPGKYTLTFQSRLGGTSGLLPAASASFTIK